MALKKDIVITKANFEGSLTHKDGYWKITRIYGDKNNIKFDVCCIVDSEINYQVSEHFKPALDGKNFIAQAYEHLKTLPEFANATDC
jgi:hypothetical protein